METEREELELREKEKTDRNPGGREILQLLLIFIDSAN